MFPTMFRLSSSQCFLGVHLRCFQPCFVEWFSETGCRRFCQVGKVASYRVTGSVIARDMGIAPSSTMPRSSTRNIVECTRNFVRCTRNIVQCTASSTRLVSGSWHFQAFRRCDWIVSRVNSNLRGGGSSAWAKATRDELTCRKNGGRRMGIVDSKSIWIHPN